MSRVSHGVPGCEEHCRGREESRQKGKYQLISMLLNPKTDVWMQAKSP